jgi:hypothetical protein
MRDRYLALQEPASNRSILATFWVTLVEKSLCGAARQGVTKAFVTTPILIDNANVFCVVASFSDSGFWILQSDFQVGSMPDE